MKPDHLGLRYSFTVNVPSFRGSSVLPFLINMHSAGEETISNANNFIHAAVMKAETLLFLTHNTKNIKHFHVKTLFKTL